MSALTSLHVNTETGWRGGETQTLQLVRGLEARGHRCVLAAQPGGELLQRAGAAGVEAVPLSMRGECDLPAARRLAALIERRGVDLLHYHTAHAVSIGTLATLFSGRRAAIAVRRVSFPLRRRLFGRYKYRFRVDRVVAVSDAIRRGLIAQGLDPRRVVTVHSGIDPDRYARGDRSRFRASLPEPARGWPADAFVVGTAGHLATNKGHDLFLRAAVAAGRELPSARFAIVGRGERERALPRLAASLGLSGRVVFAGYRDDMPDVYAGLDLFVLASTSGEGSPAVLKESMAAGVPVVATSVAGVEEIVEDGRHGLLTPPGDVPALARAMVLLASDTALRSRLAAAARQKVREFSLDRMIASVESMYEALGGARWDG